MNKKPFMDECIFDGKFRERIKKIVEKRYSMFYAYYL